MGIGEGEDWARVVTHGHGITSPGLHLEGSRTPPKSIIKAVAEKRGPCSSNIYDLKGLRIISSLCLNLKYKVHQRDTGVPNHTSHKPEV